MMYRIGERVLVTNESGVQWSAVVQDMIGDLYQVRYDGNQMGALKSEDQLKRYEEV